MTGFFIGIAMVFGTMFGGVSQFAATCPGSSFFSLPTWYKYLPKDEANSAITKKCEVSFELMEGGKFNGDGIILVTLAIIDILIRVAGLVAVAFIIWGGFQYMTSQGSPDNAKAAQSTILNAVIGLVVALLAASIVAFIGFSIG